MKKRVFRSSRWWWSALTLVLPLGLAVILDSARARVGSAVEGAAEDLAEASQENATSAADVIIRAQKEMRQAQIDNLAAELCQELRRNNYQISDNFFTKFRDFVDKENASLSADVGTRFDPKYEATSEPSAISIVDKDVQHVYSCKLRNPRPDSKPTDDEAKTASCPAEGSPLDEKDLESLAAVKEAAKEIPGVEVVCAEHKKKSELGGICVGRCPDERPVFINLTGHPDLVVDGMDARANFIKDHCSACPKDRPHYDSRSNECLRCKPSKASSSAEGTGQQAACVECPYGFDPTEDEERCLGTSLACGVCQQAAEVAENWSVQDFLDASAEILSSCDQEELRENLEGAKRVVYKRYQRKYDVCVKRFVGQEFDPEEIDLWRLCHIMGDNMAQDIVSMSCFESADFPRKASKEEQVELSKKLNQPNVDLIRRQMEAGR